MIPLCKICGAGTSFLHNAKILRKYEIAYFECKECGFVQSEEPYWLTEAYDSPINRTDTGILLRNEQLRDISSSLLYFFFGRSHQYLDYAGGYGVFTRMMRDIGFNYLWMDPYTQNIFAKGFEYTGAEIVKALTAFEVFEHFVDPLGEIEKMISISRNIIFSTELMPAKTPAPGEWWYYGLEHGQHIAFYRERTLRHIAKKKGLQFYSNGTTIHLFTEYRMPEWLLSIVFRFNTKGISQYVKRNVTSKTFSDMQELIAAQNK